jgi:hypothetical protein
MQVVSGTRQSLLWVVLLQPPIGFGVTPDVLTLLLPANLLVAQLPSQPLSFCLQENILKEYKK